MVASERAFARCLIAIVHAQFGSHMPTYRASFGKGFIIGAGAAAVWATARYYGRRAEVQHQLIDWERATSIALQACGAGAELPAGGAPRLFSRSFPACLVAAPACLY